MSSLHLELAEAKKFISIATQPGIKQLLDQYVINLEEALKEIKNEQETKKSSCNENDDNGLIHHDANTNRNSNEDNTFFPKQIPITSYSWDETDTEVKIYLKLPCSESNHQKIVFSIKTEANEKCLRIDFLLFSSSDDATNNNGASNKLPCEIYSFVVSPLKHELENICGNFTLLPLVIAANDDDKVKNNNGTDNEKHHQHFMTTSNNNLAVCSFVYPGETRTPSGGILRYCRLKVKKNGDVVVGIQKVMPGTWADLIDKDDFNKPLAFGSTGGKSRHDPNVKHTASLVSLMQQLYRDGDEEMRKTIATAWHESRSMPPPPE